MRTINTYFVTKYLLTALLLFSCVIIGAQYNPPSFYQNKNIDTTLENSLVFRIENSNFLKNNEYFNDIIQGYTLIGYFINPKLTFYPAKNAKIEAGVHFLKYSGIDNFTKAIPTLTFHYKASKSTDIILGTLYGTTNHEMIEPLFRYEYFYTDNVENGLQFLFDTPVYRGDIWINWQQFIFKGEDKQEIFTLGLSNKIFLNHRENRHSFSISLQSVFVHQGGQINETSKSLVTLNNTALGLNYTYKPENRFIKSASIESFYVGFIDMSTDYQLPYIQGYGIYTNASVKASYFDFRVSHWYGDYFVSGRGHPIFTTVSTIYKSYSEPQRALISSRLMFEKNILKGLDIGAGFESYFDLYNYYVDYWYMFYINFNRDFFIKKFK
ncbi:MAG: hypothetical protein P1P88_02740 [Bacteroidales bacterium]|nr:hypothetical protein [Bacteroidales bacterium]